MDGIMRRLKIVIKIAALAATLATGCQRSDSKQPEGNTVSSKRIRTLNESNFDAGIQNGVVLVDFWARWCGPCKIQDPILEQVAEQVEGKAKIAKVDVDSAPNLLKRFGISAIPSLVVFKNGKITKQFEGVIKTEPLLSAVTAAVEAK
jgi:thioredoxin 1